MGEPIPTRSTFRDLTSLGPFGRLAIVEFHGMLDGSSCKYPAWLCRCECGNTTLVRSSSLLNGTTRSCGCLHVDTAKKHGAAQWKHGQIYTSEYRSWAGMFDRCTNPNNGSFSRYGGRGITVCAAWSDFRIFMQDMGAKPSPQHSLDRIDVNGIYCPENCRWADSVQQNRNKRSNISITFRGETKLLIEWAQLLGFTYYTLIHRICTRKWDVERALTQPQRHPRRDHLRKQCLSHEASASHPEGHTP